MQHAPRGHATGSRTSSLRPGCQLARERGTRFIFTGNSVSVGNGSVQSTQMTGRRVGPENKGKLHRMERCCAAQWNGHALTRSEIVECVLHASGMIKETLCSCQRPFRLPAIFSCAWPLSVLSLCQPIALITWLDFVVHADAAVVKTCRPGRVWKRNKMSCSVQIPCCNWTGLSALRFGLLWAHNWKLQRRKV
jgi:hypothetical protein